MYALVPSSKVFLTGFPLPFDLAVGEQNHHCKVRHVGIKKPAPLGDRELSGPQGYAQRISQVQHARLLSGRRTCQSSSVTPIYK